MINGGKKLNFKKIGFVLLFIMLLSGVGASTSEIVKADVADSGHSKGTVSFYGTYPSSEPDKQPGSLPNTGEQKNPIIQVMGGGTVLLGLSTVILLNYKKEKKEKKEN